MAAARKGTAKKMQLSDLLSRHGAAKSEADITFGDYFSLVQAEPSLAQLSHARRNAMLTADGTREAKEFFDGIIFGADAPLEAFTSVIRSASRRTEIRKRIILLMGPPGAGKSTIVDALKKGLERYTRRHPLYAIAFCPINEEPLHLLPTDSRAELAKEGIYVEGGLCPFCEKRVREQYPDITDVPVKQITLSEARRIGIGTFSASDSKNQSVDDLVGSVNISKIAEFSEDDPEAYSYNGEILVSNRGALELIEMFKANAELLYELLNVTQEQQVKLPRLPMCPVDLVLLAHTNQAEFEKFLGDRKNEALRDRIVPIRVPYTLSVTDEMKIYDRLLASGELQGVHIPQTSVKVAAQFAVMTRLTESDRLKTSDENKSGLVKKMKLYNGERITGITDAEVKALHEESPDEGMNGAGPRQIINALSQAATNAKSKDAQAICMTPISTLKAIDQMIRSNIQLTDSNKQFLLDRASIVYEMFNEDIKTEVQKGFVHGFEDAGASMFSQYIDNVLAFLNEEKVLNPVTEAEEEPNERFMRRIEEMINVGENQARAFREEVSHKLAAAGRTGRNFDYQSHPALKEGIEKALFHDLKDAISITTSQSHDPEKRKRFNEVVTSMKELGWCEVCAGESIKFVAQQLV